ncbi:MAG: LPP20 family lipoprotein [Treponema sp.]|nr:LPP20 family lipoprotein [Treponema sp.]
MKRTAIFRFIFFLLTTVFCFAKSPPVPEWVSNHRMVYPESEYLAQRGSGETAEKAQTDAASALARYFQMTVSANLSTTMQSITSGKSERRHRSVGGKPKRRAVASAAQFVSHIKLSKTGVSIKNVPERIKGE